MEKVFGARENAANLIVIRRRRRETNSSNLLPGHKAYTQGKYRELFIGNKCPFAKLRYISFEIYLKYLELKCKPLKIVHRPCHYFFKIPHTLFI